MSRALDLARARALAYLCGCARVGCLSVTVRNDHSNPLMNTVWIKLPNHVPPRKTGCGFLSAVHSVIPHHLFHLPLLQQSHTSQPGRAPAEGTSCSIS